MGERVYNWDIKDYNECDIEIDNETISLDLYPFSSVGTLGLSKDNSYTYTTEVEYLAYCYEAVLTSISENMIIMEVNKIGTASYTTDSSESTYYVLYREKQ